MLMQRVITAIVLVPLAIAAIMLLPNAAFATLVAVMLMLATWEWTTLMQLQGDLNRAVYVLVVSGVMLTLYLFRFDDSMLRLIMGIALAWWCVALVWILRYPAGLTAGQPKMTLKTAVGLLLIAPPFLALVVLHGRADHGPQWILFLFVLIWAADTGAYFSGRSFGRHKMAISISPGKTWEGAAGGLLLSGAVAVGAGLWLFHFQGQQLVMFALMCLGVAVFSIVGDLTESMFKRHVGMKDSGALFPGHGGVLDRFDSLTAAAPLFLSGLLLLGL